MRFPAAAAAFAVLLSAAGARAQGTGPATRPADLKLAQIADSAALSTALRALPAPPSRNPVVYSVRYDSTGARAVVTPLWDVPAAYDSLVAPILRARLAERVASGSWAPFWLRVEGGPHGGAREYVARMERAPRLLHADVAGVALQRIYAAHATQLPGGRATIVVRMQVMADGHTSGAEVVRGSGVSAADADVLAAMQRLAFQPATLDGHPMAVWVTLPMTLEPRTPRHGEVPASGPLPVGP